MRVTCKITEGMALENCSCWTQLNLLAHSRWPRSGGDREDLLSRAAFNETRRHYASEIRSRAPS